MRTTNVAVRNRAEVRRQIRNRCLVFAALLVIGAQCCGARAQTVLKKAVFAKDLAKNQAPVNPSNDFYPTDTVCLSLQIKGRPSKGIAAAKFYFGNQLITSAQVDVAEINRGVLFSVGTDTFVGFTLHPNSPLPISDKYRVETSFDGKPWGIFRFRVTPPAGALSSHIISATLAKLVGPYARYLLFLRALCPLPAGCGS